MDRYDVKYFLRMRGKHLSSLMYWLISGVIGVLLFLFFSIGGAVLWARPTINGIPFPIIVTLGSVAIFVVHGFLGEDVHKRTDLFAYMFMGAVVAFFTLLVTYMSYIGFQALPWGLIREFSPVN